MPRTVYCLNAAGLDPEQAEAQPFIDSIKIYIYQDTLGTAVLVVLMCLTQHI